MTKYFSVRFWRYKRTRRIGQAVKTSPSHGENRGSIPLRAADCKWKFNSPTQKVLETITFRVFFISKGSEVAVFFFRFLSFWKNAATTLINRLPPAHYSGRHKQKLQDRKLAGRSDNKWRVILRKKCEAFLWKGGSRLWKTLVFRERPSPFLKPRPTDAFRNITSLLSLSDHLRQSALATFMPTFLT